MFFLKACQNFVIFPHKSSLALKYYSSRLFSVNAPLKTNRTYSRLTNTIFASAAAIGLSIYIVYKRTLCEPVEIIESKEFNFPVCQSAYDEAIRKSRDLLQRVKDEFGAPGMVVGVSIDGKTIWTEGLGYSDIENRVLCTPDTVMRIASISKSITMAAVAKLWEEGKLDLDKPIQEYVPYFPPKYFNKKQVTITCRQLVSHLGGIRHYDKAALKKTEVIGTTEKKKNEVSEFEAKEYHIKEHFKDVKSSLDMFKDDPLIANPGSKFYYSTHGWTLISAIVEAASKEPFSTHMIKLFKSLGMSNTYLDVNDALIYYRSRNYRKDKNGRVINAPYVDNSYKWAGGGFLSNVVDLLKFGNMMLYSLQYNNHLLSRNFENMEKPNDIDKKILNTSSNKESKISNKQIRPGFLNSKTVETLWTPVADTKDAKYGMGWFILPEVRECQFCESKISVFHTGGAIGASSVLLIIPQSNNEVSNFNLSCEPKGVVIAILTNLESVSMQKTALKIAQIFDNQLK